MEQQGGTPEGACQDSALPLRQPVGRLRTCSRPGQRHRGDAYQAAGQRAVEEQRDGVPVDERVRSPRQAGDGACMLCPYRGCQGHERHAFLCAAGQLAGHVHGREAGHGLCRIPDLRHGVHARELRRAGRDPRFLFRLHQSLLYVLGRRQRPHPSGHTHDRMPPRHISRGSVFPFRPP